MSPSGFKRCAWVTLLTKADYLPGVLVLHRSLQAVGSRHPLVVMATPQLDSTSRNVVARRGISIRDIPSLSPRPGTHKLADHDRRFEDTWTKLRAFELYEYDRVVMLDADMVVRKNMDELMDFNLPRDHIAATHVCACNPRKYSHYPADWVPENCAHSTMAWPNCLNTPPRISSTSPRPYGLLNSGLVVLTPSPKSFKAIADFLQTSEEVTKFGFPDQDLLSAVFAGYWKPLPYVYNALKPLRFVHPRMWRDEDVKCCHYIMEKPWQARPGSKKEKSEHAVTHGWWWDQYQLLEKEMCLDGSSTDQKAWKWMDHFVSRD